MPNSHSNEPLPIRGKVSCPDHGDVYVREPGNVDCPTCDRRLYNAQNRSEPAGQVPATG